MAAGLLLVLALRLGLGANRLAVGNLGRFERDFNVEAPLEFRNRHFHVLLARAGEQKLLRLRVAREPQQQVFFQHAMDGGGELVFVAARLGLDGERDGGFGELHLGENDGRGLVAERVACQGVLQLRHRADIARVELRHGGLSFPLRHADMGEAFRGPAVEVGKVGFVLDDAGHDFKVADAAGKGISDRLEHVGRNRLGVGDLALDGLAAFVVQALNFASLQGRRQVIHQEIQQSSHCRC